MGEKSEKVAKKDDKLFTINKETDEVMTKVIVKQRKLYEAPFCTVIKIDGQSDLLHGLCT